MSEAAQELVVDSSLAEELERRGVHVHAGSRYRLEVVPELASDDRDPLDDFIGAFEAPEHDLSERVKSIARAEMGR